MQICQFGKQYGLILQKWIYPKPLIPTVSVRFNCKCRPADGVIGGGEVVVLAGGLAIV